MERIDHGLGVFGLLALATTLAVLLTVGIPIVLAPEPIKLSDWLGFAGNVLGAMITLSAAYAAWSAVQRQIGSQREQMLLDTMIREADRLQAGFAGHRACLTLLSDCKNQLIECVEPRHYAEALRKRDLYRSNEELVKLVNSEGRGADDIVIGTTIVALNLLRMEVEALERWLDFKDEFVEFEAPDLIEKELSSTLADIETRKEQLERGHKDLIERLHRDLKRYSAYRERIVAAVNT